MLKHNESVRIGELAGLTGLTVDAIRFYERQGLLPQVHRTEGGYRVFGRSDVQTIVFIVKAQELGFSLREIRELLLLRSGALHACDEVQILLEEKLAAVRSRISELSELQHHLKSALRKCRRDLKDGAKEHADCCPLLEEIGQSKGAPDTRKRRARRPPERSIRNL